MIYNYEPFLQISVVSDTQVTIKAHWPLVVTFQCFETQGAKQGIVLGLLKRVLFLE